FKPMYFLLSFVGLFPYSIQFPRENRSIFRLELFYVKALRIKQDINKAFQTPLALIISICFHTVLRESHNLYHGLVNKIGKVLKNFTDFPTNDIPTKNKERLCLEVNKFKYK
ncbi:uncharacterized protein LOC125229122, partial [Leguminivora glycinivorella]|uniref:uncharacterized protein LOC125229122 n=1 Tax=Leguminivora glycinivorella TaxID=1035111 RepID=UPI00200D1F0B